MTKSERDMAMYLAFMITDQCEGIITRATDQTLNEKSLNRSIGAIEDILTELKKRQSKAKNDQRKKEDIFTRFYNTIKGESR